MYIVAKKKTENKWQVQIVESVREGSKVKQKIIRNIGTAFSDAEVTQFKKIGEDIIIRIKNAQKPVLPFCDPKEVHAIKNKSKKTTDSVIISNLREEKRINEGFQEVFGEMIRRINFDRLIDKTNKSSEWNSILSATILARIADPRSKLATHRFLESEFGLDIPVQKIYRMLDHLADQEEPIKKKIYHSSKSLLKEDVDVLFFDVTTLYFESVISDELRNFGFSKDCKFKESQVVLALVTTTSGLPITYRLFPGNTYEGHTLLAMVEDLKNNYNVQNVLLVADRGMFSRDNLNAMDEAGINYIVAAKLKSLTKKLKNEILSREYKLIQVSGDLNWAQNFDHDGRRLIVSYSSKRAKKDSTDRARLVERLLKKVKNDKIKIGDLIPNQGTKKYLKIKEGEAHINYEKMENDEHWDGFHGVITNNKSDSNQSILERYRGLWQIEEAFRINKHSLKMRPIYHFSPRRIKAHVLLCYISFALAKQVCFRLAQSGLNISLESLREHLGKVEASTVSDKTTGKKYVIPSKITETQKNIYSLLKLKRNCTPYAI